MMSRSTLRNLEWAVVVGAMIGLSPHTSGQRVLPSVLGGVAAGALVFGYREIAARRPGQPAEVAPATRRPEVPASLLVATLLFFAVFAPTFVFLYRDWTASIWQNGHGIFIPVLMALLIARILQSRPPAPAAASAWGFAFVVPGLLLVGFDAGIHTEYLAAAGLALCLPGLSLLVLGTQRTRALALPLVLGLLLVPIPTQAAYFVGLPLAVAAVTAPLVELVGVPVVRIETMLVLPGEVFGITDRCSGFACFVPATALSIFLALRTHSWPRRALVLLAPWPLVVAANAVRSAVLVVISNRTGVPVLEMASHGLSGIAAFWLVMGAILLLAGRRTLRGALA